jgi:hypothetical protein
MFIVFLTINKNIKIKEIIRLTKFQESGLITKQKSYYILIYRRFNYFSLNKIITINTLIKILVEK